jgi:hypothetical protein
MANVADAIDIAAMTDLVVRAKSDGARTAGVTALKAVLAKAQDKEVAGKIILDQMSKARGQTRLALLSSLPSLGGATALKAVTDAARSSDEAVRDAGIRALSEWPDYQAVPALVDIASNAQTPLNPHVLAVRGALRLIALQQPSVGPRMGPPTSLRMGPRMDPAEVESRAVLCVKILDLARRIEEKRQAIATLATLPCERSANRLLELVQDESLKNEAALAAVNLAGAMLRTNRQTAQELAQKILDMNVSADINDQAKPSRGQRDARAAERAQ